MEQNHSSVKAYLGEGGALSLLENIQKLFQRHMQHTNERCWVANNILVCLLSYTGSVGGLVVSRFTHNGVGGGFASYTN